MITTTTGAKKLEGTDNWRQIIPAHNDSVDAYDGALATQNQAIANVNSKIANFISKDYGTLTWTTDLKTSIVNLLGSVYSDCPINGNIMFCGFFTGRGAMNGVASRKNSILEYHISALNNDSINGYYASSSNYTYNDVAEKIANMHKSVNLTSTDTLYSITDNRNPSEGEFVTFTCSGALASDMPQSAHKYGAGFIVNGNFYKEAFYYADDYKLYIGKRAYHQTAWVWYYVQMTAVS